MTRERILEILAAGEEMETGSDDRDQVHNYEQRAIMKYLSVIAHSLFQEDD